MLVAQANKYLREGQEEQKGGTREKDLTAGPKPLADLAAFAPQQW